MKRHLNICINIEETVAKIYRNLIQSPRLTTVVKETLLELADDEDDHANQLRFALRFPEASMIASRVETRQQAEALLQESKNILEKTLKIEIDDQQAISIGIELEKRFCEVHIANSFEFKEEKFKAMFAAMAKEDERHCRKLLELKKSIGQPS